MMVDFMMVVLDLCFPTKTLLTQCVLKETEILFLGTHSEKNYGIIWEFFPNGGPPTPPFWEPLLQKKNL